MLGNEQIVYTQANGNNICAILPPNYKIGNEITLKINTNNLIFFDSETLLRI